MPDVKFCLVFQRETLSVPVMRRVLGDTLRGLGMDEESVYDILLAATEACTNVLTHGGRKVRGYEVVTSLGAVGCQVEVADEGVGLAPGNPALSNPALSNPALSNPALSNPAPSDSAERGAPDPQQTPIALLPESLALLSSLASGAALRRRLPSSLLRRSSVQATPRPLWLAREISLLRADWGHQLSWVAG